MKQSRFNNAITALVNSFFNETLHKGDCTACAVGNIIAHSMSGDIIVDNHRIIGSNVNNNLWSVFFHTVEGKQKVANKNEILQRTRSFSGELITISVPVSTPSHKFYQNAAFEAIKSTGYSQEELMRIEYAFEVNTKILGVDYSIYSRDEVVADQYNGLMAVVDVLCDIEGMNKEEIKETKKMFEYASE